MLNWHTLDIQKTFSELQSSPAGLNSEECQARLAEHGPNELVDKGLKDPFKIIFEQLSSLMVLILLAAGALSLFLGKYLEAGSIFAIVALFVILGFLQEYRAEKAIAALKKLSVPLVRVRRNGNLADIAARDLVPGDIVILEAGSHVPADLRIIESANLRIQESALTGEAEAVEKHSAALADPEVALGDRTNLAYMGTAVSYGRGSGVVIKTGMRTELGTIAGLLQTVNQSATPLQQKLDKVGLILAIAGVSVAGLIMLIGLLAGGKLQDMILTAISVAVAVVPEGLPAILTFTLAMGAQRMLKRNALIRKLPAVETLGSVSVICSDKTGTLTENRMTVTAIDVAGHHIDINDKLLLNHKPGGPAWLDAIDLVLCTAVLCNDAVLQRRAADGALLPVGDPTESALLVAAGKRGLDKGLLERSLPRQAEIPFDSERKRMSTFHLPDFSPGPDDDLIERLFTLIGIKQGSAGIVFAKGAVDSLLPLANRYWNGSSVEHMDADTRARIHQTNNEMAAKGMRVLGFAFQPLYVEIPKSDYEQDLIFVGMTSIIDPPRPEVKAAVATCRVAGIRPIMITGDHPLTAAYIAGELGISADKKVLTGADLQRMAGDQLALAVQDVSVFARVSPEHKLRIVESLQSQGNVVAMTGDGVNDAPALKKADIGVAMGISGTDVAKEAASMVLRDDNFATIVAAVEEGRSIYDNIRSYIGFSVAGNLGKVAFMLLWPLVFLLSGAGLQEAVALLPLQLLWLNLLTDGLLGLAIGLEPVSKTTMFRPPIARNTGIFSGGVGGQILRIGLIECLISLGVGAAYHFQGLPQWQTMVVLTMSFLQVGQALAMRNPAISIFRNNFLGNRVLIALSAGVIALQVLVLNVPFLSQALGMVSISLADFGLTLACGMAMVLIIELGKLIKYKFATLNG